MNCRQRSHPNYLQVTGNNTRQLEIQPSELGKLGQAGCPPHKIYDIKVCTLFT